MPRPTESPAWQALQTHRQDLAGTRLADLFAADESRASRLSLEAAGLFYDFSKQPLTEETLKLLLQLAEDAGLPVQTRALFAGEKLNQSEGRAAWHTALRAGEQAPEEVRAEVSRMERFVDDVRDARWLGCTNEPITDVVNIGIGGSDLGPRMVCHALSPQADGPRLHFVANADGPELSLALKGLNPSTTLFIVISKSFGTAETFSNAQAALHWLGEAGSPAQRGRHVVTVSANKEAHSQLELPAENNFLLWDWVGGRFSLWSTVGLSIALSLGMPLFRELLEGAAAMDAHFREAEPARNMPVLQALLGVWQGNFLGASQQVILPYSHLLEYLPAYLQQLEMESNGKSVDRDGQPIDYSTGLSIWGQAGTNAQHAFLQWLQQGGAKIPVDFILPLSVPLQSEDEKRFMVANCLAQSAALMHGHRPENAANERVLPGDRPSSTILMSQLDARHLGALLALYEHKVFVQSVIWHINPFDQWGVERGKQMAKGLISELEAGQPADYDASTRQLAARYLSGLQKT